MVRIAEVIMALVVVQLLSGCAMSEDNGQADYYKGLASQQDLQKISAIPAEKKPIAVNQSNEITDHAPQVVDTQKSEIPRSEGNTSAETVRFRENLKIGDMSQCGMVVKIRRPIVKIQMADNERWIRISEIYPAGSGRLCRFNVGGR